MKTLRPTVLPMLAAAAMAAFPAPPPESPFTAPPAGLSGQIRTRTEWDGKAVADRSGNDPFLYTNLRSRLGYASATPDGFTYRFEAQDSRSMGSEPSSANPATASSGNSKGLDLLQAYATWTHGGFAGALGRQKLSLGSGRFLSTLEWSPYSRAFDGLSLNWSHASGNLTGIAFLVKDSADKAVEDRLALMGLFYTHDLTAAITADAYLFYDQARIAAAYGGTTTRNYDLAYAGGRIAGRLGMAAFEAELIWQGGELHSTRALTSEAYQAALRLGMALPSAKVNAGLDIMSGDDDPADAVASGYRANYYFAHAYYGWMDYFVVNPAYGVMDFRLDGEYGIPGTSRSKLRVQYHWFLPHQAPSGSDEAYGHEVDCEIQLGVGAKSSLLVGGGIFLPGDGAAALPAAALAAGADTRTGFLVYFMPTFNF